MAIDLCSSCSWMMCIFLVHNAMYIICKLKSHLQFIAYFFFLFPCFLQSFFYNSFNNFFLSCQCLLVMMYGGLQRETGQVHRPRPTNRNITPEELEGLEAVLKLTERIADQVILKK